jgi:hypothetical protein
MCLVSHCASDGTVWPRGLNLQPLTHRSPQSLMLGVIVYRPDVLDAPAARRSGPATGPGRGLHIATYPTSRDYEPRRSPQISSTRPANPQRTALRLTRSRHSDKSQVRRADLLGGEHRDVMRWRAPPTMTRCGRCCIATTRSDPAGSYPRCP